MFTSCMFRRLLVSVLEHQTMHSAVVTTVTIAVAGAGPVVSGVAVAVAVVPEGAAVAAVGVAVARVAVAVVAVTVAGVGARGRDDRHQGCQKDQLWREKMV